MPVRYNGEASTLLGGLCVVYDGKAYALSVGHCVIWGRDVW